ncbi:MAG: hypothetical protein ABSD59_24205 [Terracidiphilus sp.]|jgi:hypothetical protein
MPNAKLPIDWSLWPAGKIALPSALLLLAFSMAGCGGSVTGTQSGTAASAGPQTYFAPIVAGTTYSTSTSPASGSALANPLTYTLDDTARAFSQTTYVPQTEPGPQILNSGIVTMGQRGLRSLGITASYAYNSNTSQYQVTTYPVNSPESGSFAVELPNRAGGLVKLVGQPTAPMAPATACPGSS